MGDRRGDARRGEGRGLSEEERGLEGEIRDGIGIREPHQL